MQPIWVASLMGGLIQLMPTLVGKVLIVLGLGTITYTGINLVFEELRGIMVDAFGSADLVGMAAVLKLDVCLSMLIAAATFKHLLNSGVAGSVTKWTKARPTAAP